MNQTYIKPLRQHLRYVKAILDSRDDNAKNDIAFRNQLLDNEPAAWELFYHGVNALYRSSKCLEEPSLKFHEFDLPRLDDKPISAELIELYRNTISEFEDSCKKFDEDQLDEVIKAPHTGQEMRREDFVVAGIWHTIHHVGQALRLQGIAFRQLINIID
jgi:hypothetical protein